MSKGTNLSFSLMSPKQLSLYDDDEKSFLTIPCTRAGPKEWTFLSGNALPFISPSAVSGNVRWGHGAWLKTEYGVAPCEDYGTLSNENGIRLWRVCITKVMVNHRGYDTPSLASKYQLYFTACADPPAPICVADAMPSDTSIPSGIPTPQQTATQQWNKSCATSWHARGDIVMGTVVSIIEAI